jgi:hypothetical protein
LCALQKFVDAIAGGEFIGRAEGGKGGANDAFVSDAGRLVEDVGMDLFDDVIRVFGAQGAKLSAEVREVGIDGFLSFGRENHAVSFLPFGTGRASSFRCASRLFMRAENLAQMRVISRARWRPAGVSL